MKAFSLEQFVAESNKIEGIHRKPTKDEIAAHRAFLSPPTFWIEDVVSFVSVIAPNKPLRDRAGLNVRVGNYLAPPGGPEIRAKLEQILSLARNSNPVAAFEIHRKYERLHPFMDGNGRSGRVIWLKMMGGINRVPLGFLHTWYYQSLQEQP